MPRAKRIKKPKHRTEVRSYAFAMDVCGNEAAQFFRVLDVCHGVRNTLVTDQHNNRQAMREDASVKYLTKNDQYKKISQMFRSDPAIREIHSQVLQNIADRIDEGTKRWFDAIKEGRRHVSPPKPIERKRYKSFTYTQYGSAACIKNGRLHLSKLGSFKLFDHRKIRGKKKSVTIKWKDGRWWAIITAEIQAVDLYAPESTWKDKSDVGIDPGLKRVLIDSAGTEYSTPRPLREAQKKLKSAQKKMSRQLEARKAAHEALMVDIKEAGLETVPLKNSPYSERLKKQIRCIAKQHTKVTRARDYAAKKNAAIASDLFCRVAVEEHSIGFMMANRKTARAAADVAIGAQKHALQSKMGARYIAAPNRRTGLGGNSQTCLCGAPVRKKLNERYHQCTECGIEGDRDWISANIVQHTTFGSVHESLTRACGQQVLDKALALLEMRGEDKAMCGETRPGRNRDSVESSVKRTPRVSGKAGQTAGGEPTAVGKTAEHRKGRSHSGSLPSCAKNPAVDPKGLSGSPTVR